MNMDETPHEKIVDFVQPALDKPLEKISTQANSKEISRKNARRRQILDENIQIRILDNDVNTEDETTFNIQRKNLTSSHLENLINHTIVVRGINEAYSLAYVREFDTGEIILPQNMQSLCKALPSWYQAVQKKKLNVDDSLQHTNYEGDSKFIVKGIPQKTQNEQYMVTNDDVRNWIIMAIVNDEVEIRNYDKKLSKLSEDLQGMAKCMKLIPTKPIYNKKGKEIIGAKASVEREKEFHELSDRYSLAKIQHDTISKKRKTTIQEKSNLIQFSISTAEANHRKNQKHYIIEFYGHNKDYNENILLKKQDWNSIPLFVSTSKARKEKETVQNHRDSEFLVDMSEISLERMKDGFGVSYSMQNPNIMLKSKLDTNENDSPQNKKLEQIHKFDLYYGMFENGKKSGYGIVYNDEGIYFGEMKENLPCGKGTLYCANGDRIKAYFRINDKGKEFQSDYGKNPYLRGLPDGKCSICFTDGGFYEGFMSDGMITGDGVYIDALGERIEGTFENGILQGQGSMTTPLGEKVEGNFENGELNGYGSFTSPTYEFKGFYEEGEKSGKGIEQLQMNILPQKKHIELASLQSREKLTMTFEGVFRNNKKIWNGEQKIVLSSKKDAKVNTINISRRDIQSTWLENRIAMSKPTKEAEKICDNKIDKKILRGQSPYFLCKMIKSHCKKRKSYYKKKTLNMRQINKALGNEIANKKRIIYERHLDNFISHIHNSEITSNYTIDFKTEQNSSPDSGFFDYRAMTTLPQSFQEAENHPGLKIGVKSLSSEKSELLNEFDFINNKIKQNGHMNPKTQHLANRLKNVFQVIDVKWKLVKIDKLESKIKKANI